MDDDIQHYKIVLIGNSGTGKTNITTRYIKGEFQDNLQASVGAQFFAKEIVIKGKKIKVTLWDTAGQERFKSLSKVYYKGARGIMVVYDVTEPQSYVDIESWLKLANQTVSLSEITVFVVGNKIDLEKDRKVTYDRAVKEYKEEFDVDCWEVSAKTGHHIDEVFNSMFQQIYQKAIEVKNSMFFGSELVTYSQLERDSLPWQRNKPNKQGPTEMKPIGELVIQQHQQGSHFARVADLPNLQSRMTLTNADHAQLTQQKKKRRCCH